MQRMNFLKPYQPVVASILNQSRPATILDAPSGSGWLKGLLGFDAQIDGLDLFAPPPDAYRTFRSIDLDLGLPDDLGLYEAIVCCEGIEHFGNPDLFFRTARRHLVHGGRLIVTTPNVWFPEARLQFFLRGFFPSFPCLVGRIERGTHMHIMPWSFPQLFLFLRLNGFEDITLHDTEEKKPKRVYERLLGIPQALYCRHKRNKSITEEERAFWSFAGSEQSIYGRRLVVSAVTPNPAGDTGVVR
ncbi:MAG: methyltransferase type 11 [Hydrogenophilales bacterium CG_4_9_14_3_um_filter_59_35]|nr:MAG: methyltransferase type 11 [Hydrogenophilales bacterium CG18_big_fil_WC_8_21_14_2_50_58_12]PIX99454.1 MAG: methyltransferase type 11 [Hydrogenophilales bacterium CG_4_10_14_3_um_filter_58_23]PJB05936.1 MAG: methyltransferase type 11 [Hydrogenophilales bacterium CG_4_9_14_3_um_filter_59_35]